MFARAARGSSVIELLVAAAVTGMLLTGVIAIFMSWRSSSEVTDRLATSHETGQRAIEVLAASIRSVEYPGCARTTPDSAFPRLPENDPRWDFTGAALRGYTNGTRHEMSPYAQYLAPESELLFVRGVRNGAEGMHLARAMRTPTDELEIEPSKRQLHAGNVGIIHSCRARAYFVATEVEDNVIRYQTPGNSLGHAFDTDAEILPVTATLFYLGRTAADKPLSLWRRVDDSPPEEIARGIVAMRLEYGADDDGDGIVDYYVEATSVGDWSDILSVSIELQVDPADRSVRGKASADSQTFRTVVALRNRALRNRAKAG